MDDLDHQFAWADGGQHVLAEGLLLDVLGELLSDVVVDVGLEEGASYVLEGLGDVELGDLALTLEELEGAL